MNYCIFLVIRTGAGLSLFFQHHPVDCIDGLFLLKLVFSLIVFLSQRYGDGDGTVYHFDGVFFCGYGFHSTYQYAALPRPEEFTRRFLWPNSLFLGEREWRAVRSMMLSLQ